ncbi:MAG TPA: tRNA pseudouridine(38-40) synthase TruA [Acidimicrobiia bacterium]|nr:tRNA pseudouridine(38-40) synthase TruA [Acidimicrobiia bacterium]
MPRYRLDLAYDGSDFHGFARQPGGVRTVAGVLEEALGRVFRQDVSLVVAGRTDTGVHARHQVVSFDADREVDTGQVRRAVSSMLGPEVVAVRCVVAEPGFSARFDAVARTYRYHLLDSEVADPLRRRTVWHVGHALDVAAMDVAAHGFVGDRDFATFCRRREGKGTQRTVHAAGVRRDDDLVVFEIRAKAFCHQMVRSLTGFLVEVGRGRRAADSVAEVLAARDRSVVPSPAPPGGLVLWQVDY